MLTQCKCFAILHFHNTIQNYSFDVSPVVKWLHIFGVAETMRDGGEDQVGFGSVDSSWVRLGEEELEKNSPACYLKIAAKVK